MTNIKKIYFIIAERKIVTIEDLVTSAKLFNGGSKDYLERPCIILYREKDAKLPYIKYSVLINNNPKLNTSNIYNKCLYETIKDMPEEIVSLIDVLHNN